MRPSIARWVWDTVVVLAAMAGVFLRNLTLLRVLTSVVVLGASVAFVAYPARISGRGALAAFVGVYVVRYAFLFLSFTRHGVASRLRATLGPTRGFAVYESLTALMFFARGITFAWLVETTDVSVIVGARVSQFLVAAGVALAVAGTVVNVWAARVVGVDTYFYRDLFDESASYGLKAEGPYRLLKNPMYGLGQAAGYGAALMSLSPAGLAATLINQLTMYAFNALIEQPHVARIARYSTCETRHATV